MNSPPQLIIHTDGASRGNPGAAAYAYIIARDGAEPIEEAGCLGELTNNQAEYEALIRALRCALELGPQHRVEVNSDSELMVKQMNGEYRVKNADLLPLYEDARQLVKRFGGGVTFRHIRRENNSRADALCNEALDGKRPSGRHDGAARLRPVKPESLREEAVRCLREAVLAWAGGDDGPTPEDMWERLREMLERRGAKLPS
jgi:ribonuclease HI